MDIKKKESYYVPTNTNGKKCMLLFRKTIKMYKYFMFNIYYIFIIY